MVRELPFRLLYHLFGSLMRGQDIINLGFSSNTVTSGGLFLDSLVAQP